jgi:hypothetical protein
MGTVRRVGGGAQRVMRRDAAVRDGDDDQGRAGHPARRQAELDGLARGRVS